MANLDGGGVNEDVPALDPVLIREQAVSSSMMSLFPLASFLAKMMTRCIYFNVELDSHKKFELFDLKTWVIGMWLQAVVNIISARPMLLLLKPWPVDK